ncbi:MAG: hypothetical protein APR63_14455 [Desulfuromonas sp. SDB]|nr:MAG: hypothetical protein APR63_14455 [Desulfuromonas sp. SDB]
MLLLKLIIQNSAFAPKTLHTSELVPIYIAFIFLGIYSTLAIYHLLVYWGRPEDKNNLHYAILIFSFMVYVIQKMLIPEFDPHYQIVPLVYRITLEGLTSVFLIFSFLYFIYYALELQTLKNQLIWGYILCILTPYIMGLILYIIIKNWNIPEIINTVIPVPWSIYIAVRIIQVFFNKKGRRYKQKWKLLIFFGIVFFYLGMIIQTIWIINVFSYFLQSLMVNIGCLAMALFSAYALTSHFNQEHYHLIDLRDNLEKKVNQRTRELEKAKLEIEKASEQKTNLFINLAHETKTPLTIIQNYLTEYMSKSPPSEELKVIQQNLNKLLRDMVNFLDAEKLERGQIFYNHDQVVNISEIVKDKLKVFRSYAHRKNINLISNLAIDLYIKADPFAFDRIINNLLDNAIKYTTQGTIDVFLDNDHSFIILKVKDSGMGISDQQQKHIFSPFYQISHAKQNIQGIGMGLYITSEIVKSLDGTINLKSEKDQGSEFTLTLPRYIPDGSENIQTDFEVSTPENFQFELELHQEKYLSQRENILVVEDNKNLLKFLQYKLSKKYNVFTAENGQIALDKITSIPLPNLILSDIMMDEMDGYQFYENMVNRDIYQDIPFIFLTAKTGDKEKLKGISLGAVDFIYKPFSADELMTRIDALLRLQKMKNSLFEQNKYFTFGKLMGGISHELINPLISISAPLENLKKYLNNLDSTTREKTQPYIERIKYNLDRITNIIKNLKSLYYQEIIKKTNLNLKKLIPPIIKLFEDYKDKKVIFSIDIEKDLSIYANYDALIQILSNLILNALDAVDEQGEIKIKAFKTEYDPVIIVKDNGKGMSREELKYIFDAFYTSKEVGEGTGLGLYIVKNLVLKMGWNISVNSEENKGSEFAITMKRK